MNKVRRYWNPITKIDQTIKFNFNDFVTIILHNIFNNMNFKCNQLKSVKDYKVSWSTYESEYLYTQVKIHKKTQKITFNHSINKLKLLVILKMLKLETIMLLQLNIIITRRSNIFYQNVCKKFQNELKIPFSYELLITAMKRTCSSVGRIQSFVKKIKTFENFYKQMDSWMMIYQSIMNIQKMIYWIYFLMIQKNAGNSQFKNDENFSKIFNIFLKQTFENGEQHFIPEKDLKLELLTISQNDQNVRQSPYFKDFVQDKETEIFVKTLLVSFDGLIATLAHQSSLQCQSPYPHIQFYNKNLKVRDSVSVIFQTILQNKVLKQAFKDGYQSNKLTNFCSEDIKYRLTKFMLFHCKMA
ncbi:unnamed protein product [Paramecium sonneborni]|uniref:Uncharacterized protein n=1 Tax=Paramecium sonneborni TaxID=65129 RepID=A0A8S1RTM2_9CILI|nr:unnamed protein product [Paramecium sonneborni]